MSKLLQAVSPAKALVDLFKMDPVAARFLAGGVGVLAAAALVISWRVDLKTMLLIGLYVLGLSLLLRLILRLPEWLHHTLGTFLVIVIISTVMLFFTAVIWNWPKPAYCLAQFWTRCEIVEERTAARNLDVEDGHAIPRTLPGPGGTVEAPRTTPSPGTGEQSPSGAAMNRPPPAAAQQTVYIQFAGLIAREEIERLNAALRRGGWQVAGSSGERTESAAGVNEVRYAAGSDPASARALADAVTNAGIVSEPVQLRAMPIIPPSSLELWISRN